MNLSELKTVCCFLGPYRNLTTLTAGTLGLHPTVQVLNHGMQRLDRIGDLDVLAGDGSRAFERFVSVAVGLSEGGERGDSGGSITLSHAFDHESMSDANQRRFGDLRRKPHIESLVWKESMRLTNRIRGEGLDVAALLTENEHLRFVHPVRNPLDCAQSNLRTGHVELLEEAQPESIETVVDAILSELAWFVALEKRHPTRFRTIFEGAVDRSTFVTLADFLGIDADEQWLDDAVEIFVTEATYDHDPDLVRHYRAEVGKRFDTWPEVRDRLLGFAATP